jgi:hypothetical protein
MKAVFSGRFARRTGRAIVFVFLALVLQGGSCDSPPPPPTQTTDTVPNGNTPNTMPAPNAIPQLIILINNFRASQGLSTLAHDPIGDLVANDEVTAWVNAGFPSPFSFDVLGDLHNRNVSVTNALDIVAQGYQDFNALYNALLNINALSGPFQQIGVALINQGNGNNWAIVMY